MAILEEEASLPSMLMLHHDVMGEPLPITSLTSNTYAATLQPTIVICSAHARQGVTDWVLTLGAKIIIAEA